MLFLVTYLFIPHMEFPLAVLVAAIPSLIGARPFCPPRYGCWQRSGAPRIKAGVCDGAKVVIARAMIPQVAPGTDQLSPFIVWLAADGACKARVPTRLSLREVSKDQRV